MRDGDLQELYLLLDMYSRTYGSQQAQGIMQEIEQRCNERGIRAGAGNTRGAGRKRKYTAEQNEQILAMRAVGIPIREIAAAIGCSTGHVQKIINEQRMSIN